MVSSEIKIDCLIVSNGTDRFTCVDLNLLLDIVIRRGSFNVFLKRIWHTFFVNFLNSSDIVL